MNSTATASPHAQRYTLRRSAGVLLGSYTDRKGRRREIVCLPGAHGSTLVVDQRAVTLEDPRVLAHLGADEPGENARIVCRLYLCDPRRPRCRALRSEDLQIAPVDVGLTESQAFAYPASAELFDSDGNRYGLGLTYNEDTSRALRWRRRLKRGAAEPLTLRAVIAALERYEPARAITVHALGSRGLQLDVSVGVLRAELQRLEQSQVVLNHGLREAVLRATASGALTMSEIATRCGRVKRDSAGKESGETSWLARRIGLLPEGGRCSPTLWVHTEVLALIAREGLGIAPREVELS